jgi:chemotaxis protein MotB
VLFDGKNPRNPINRRISIIVMTKQAEESALHTDTQDAGAELAAAQAAGPEDATAGAAPPAATATTPATATPAAVPAAPAAPSH